MLTSGRILSVGLAVLFFVHSASAGMLTFYATGIDSMDNSGTIIDDLVTGTQTVNQDLPGTTNSLAGYNSFITALGSSDFGIEDFENRGRSDFTGIGAQKDPTNISLDLNFQRLAPGMGSIPISATLTASPAILVDITLSDANPATSVIDAVNNCAGRFPVTVPIGGTQYLDTNTVDLNFLIDFHDTPVDALGFFGTDFGDFNGQVHIDVTDANGAVTSFGMPHPFDPISTPTGRLNASLLFFGFTSDAPISQVRLSAAVGSGMDINTYDRFGFDNLVVATSSPTSSVPEPSSLAMLLAGLASLGFVSRKRFRRKPLTAYTS